MKTKLTLTVDREIVENAKLKAANKGISLSKMFEEVFELENPELEKSESHYAAERLLRRLESMSPMPTQNESDKELLKKFLKEKYG